MDYRNMKLINLILGSLCLATECFVYKNSHYLARIDQIYIAVVSFFLLEALVSFLLHSKSNSMDSAWRTICFIVLFSVGGLLVYSAIQIENTDKCRTMGHKCHQYEYKITAGVLAMINGIMYLMAKAEPKAPQRTTQFLGVGPQLPSSIYILNPAHAAPPPPYPFVNDLPPPSYQSVVHTNVVLPPGNVQLPLTHVRTSIPRPTATAVPLSATPIPQPQHAPSEFKVCQKDD